MRTLYSGPSLGVDTRDFKRFSRALKRGAPELYRGMRIGMRGAGQIVADEAKSRASENSVTIPPTVKVRTSGGVTVSVIAGGPNVPIAGLFEEGNRGRGNASAGSFRHPVFGHDTWVNQPMHPFLLPAFRDKSEAVVLAMATVVDDVLKIIAYD